MRPSYWGTNPQGANLLCYECVTKSKDTYNGNRHKHAKVSTVTARLEPVTLPLYAGCSEPTELSIPYIEILLRPQYTIRLFLRLIALAPYDTADCYESGKYLLVYISSQGIPTLVY